jgi:adenosylhomocysteine nucleosidase
MQLASNAEAINYHAGSWPAAAQLGFVDAVVETRSSNAARAPLGVVTALQAEANCLRRSGDGAELLSQVSGGSGSRARAGAEQLRAAGVAGLVSFGFAIGLAPILRPGDVVVADRVVLPTGATIATAASWRAELTQRLSSTTLSVRVARIAGSDDPPLSASAKRQAFQTTFAAVMDTESHAVAEVAAAAELPLLVVRAVAEPAEAERPPIAFVATGTDGQIRSLAVVGHLARRPWEIAAAWRFSKNSRMALEALRQVAAVGPGSFAFEAI